MESHALPIFRAGHIPMLGEWLALPLVDLVGSEKIGDEAFSEIVHPVAVRLLAKCDTVLRVGGASAGANETRRKQLGLENPQQPRRNSQSRVIANAGTKKRAGAFRRRPSSALRMPTSL
jgi:hypothetical protein